LYLAAEVHVSNARYMLRERRLSLAIAPCSR